MPFLPQEGQWAATKLNFRDLLAWIGFTEEIGLLVQICLRTEVAKMCGSAMQFLKQRLLAGLLWRDRSLEQGITLAKPYIPHIPFLLKLERPLSIQ